MRSAFSIKRQDRLAFTHRRCHLQPISGDRSRNSKWLVNPKHLVIILSFMTGNWQLPDIRILKQAEEKKSPHFRPLAFLCARRQTKAQTFKIMYRFGVLHHLLTILDSIEYLGLTPSNFPEQASPDKRKPLCSRRTNHGLFQKLPIYLWPWTLWLLFRKSNKNVLGGDLLPDMGQKHHGLALLLQCRRQECILLL